MSRNTVFITAFEPCASNCDQIDYCSYHAKDHLRAHQRCFLLATNHNSSWNRNRNRTKTETETDRFRNFGSVRPKTETETETEPKNPNRSGRDPTSNKSHFQKTEHTSNVLTFKIVSYWTLIIFLTPKCETRIIHLKEKFWGNVNFNSRCKWRGKSLANRLLWSEYANTTRRETKIWTESGKACVVCRTFLAMLIICSAS